jgi:hypothetical protein
MDDFTEERFAEECNRYGFAPTDYRRPIDYGQAYLRLVGFNPRARKNHCVLQHSETGDLYNMPPEQVATEFRSNGIEWPPRKP